MSWWNHFKKSPPTPGPFDTRPENPVTEKIHLDRPSPSSGDEAIACAFGDVGLELGRGSTHNTCCSALSILQAWSRVHAGALDRTLRQIEKALPFAWEADRIASQIEGSAGTDVVVRAANSLWLREGYPVRPSYLEARADEVFDVDFQDAPGAAKRVNGWIDKATSGMITDVVDLGSLRPETVLLIANALYLDAKWREPFESSSTSGRAFELLDGSSITAETMTC